MHAGYLRRGRRAGRRRLARATRQAGATAPSCVSATSGCGCPLRARVALEGDAVRLPDGRRGRRGRRVPSRRPTRRVPPARAQAPERWALRAFRGLALSVGRGHAAGAWIAPGWCRPPSRRAACSLPARRVASRSACGARGFRPTRSARATCSSSAARPTPRITHVAFAGEARHAGALDHLVRRSGRGVVAAGHAARRRSASGSWPCGGWRQR